MHGKLRPALVDAMHESCVFLALGTGGYVLKVNSDNEEDNCRYEFMQARLLFADHKDFLFVVLDEEARRACRTGLASDVVGGDMLIMCEGMGDGPLVDRISRSIVGSFLQPGMLSSPQFRG